jgi:hypothetical protein
MPYPSPHHWWLPTESSRHAVCLRPGGSRIRPVPSGCTAVNHSALPTMGRGSSPIASPMSRQSFLRRDKPAHAPCLSGGFRTLLPRTSLAVAALVITGALLSACGSAPSEVTIGQGIRVKGSSLSPHLRATSTTVTPPTKLVALSPTLRLSPTGPLPSPVTVTIPLTVAVPTADVVVIATAEAPSGPWTYLPATGSLFPSRRHTSRGTTSLVWT